MGKPKGKQSPFHKGKCCGKATMEPQLGRHPYVVPTRYSSLWYFIMGTTCELGQQKHTMLWENQRENSPLSTRENVVERPLWSLNWVGTHMLSQRGILVYGTLSWEPLVNWDNKNTQCFCSHAICAYVDEAFLLVN
eukprot:c38645_g1_i1 orf=11-418(-)